MEMASTHALALTRQLTLKAVGYGHKEHRAPYVIAKNPSAIGVRREVATHLGWVGRKSQWLLHWLTELWMCPAIDDRSMYWNQVSPSGS